jgi:hypothetical protein
MHLLTDALAECRCTGYGLVTCTAHDSGEKPYCMRSNPPSWCADSWCYVDTDDCDKPFSSSVFFPGLSYSYFTCGASNTFDSWFSTGSGSGEVEDHKLTELVTLMKTYTTTISETLEENFIEATQVRLPPSPKPPAAQPTTTAARTPPADATRHAATRRRAALPRAHATVPTAARPWTSALSPSPAPMAPLASPSPGEGCHRMTRRPT